MHAPSLTAGTRFVAMLRLTVLPLAMLLLALSGPPVAPAAGATTPSPKPPSSIALTDWHVVLLLEDGVRRSTIAQKLKLKFIVAGLPWAKNVDFPFVLEALHSLFFLSLPDTPPVPASSPVRVAISKIIVLSKATGGLGLGGANPAEVALVIADAIIAELRKYPLPTIPKTR